MVAVMVFSSEEVSLLPSQLVEPERDEGVASPFQSLRGEA